MDRARAHLWRSSARSALSRALILSCLTLLLACSEDDEDRIDAFVAAVTGEVSEPRIDHVLTTYIDLEAAPLSATVLTTMRLYQASDRARLRSEVIERLQRAMGSSLKIIRRRTDLKHDGARVELQLYGADMMGNVVYELVKRDKRWLLQRVRVGG